MAFNRFSYSDKADRSEVFLASHNVGEIKKVDLGWQFMPKDSDEGGEVHPTREEVKGSLEIY